MASKLQENGVVKLEDTPLKIVEIVNRNATTSPLLLLPAELRNRVAEFACYSNCGHVWLMLHCMFVVTSSNRLDPAISNPLQDVSKLLRAETRVLELQINKVKVDEEVFAALHVAHDRRLRNIIGHINILARVDYLKLTPYLHRAILSYAKANPRVTVTVTIANWRFQGLQGILQGFMSVGWATEKSLRGLKKRRFAGCKKAFEAWEDGKIKEDLDLPNLRFYPSAWDFNKDKFELALLDGNEQEFVKNKILGLHGSKDKAIEAVKDWYENGL